MGKETLPSFRWLIGLSFLLLFLACNTANLNTSKSSEKSALSAAARSPNEVTYMYITKANLDAIHGDGDFKRAYIQFKTSDGKIFEGESYAWKSTDVSFVTKNFLLNSRKTVQLTTTPYIFGNLELRKRELTPIGAGDFYILEPTVDASSHYVIYNIWLYKKEDIPEDILPSKKTIDDLNPQELELFIEKVLTTIPAVTRTPAGSFNPCPPKKPDM